MRESVEGDLATADALAEMADDRVRELEERIRTLESACEAALKMVEEDINHVLQFQRALPERVCAVRDQLQEALNRREQSHG